jgi:hypothetical protein
MPVRWITADELPDDLVGTEFAQEAVDSASYLLWAMSGRKYHGVETVTEQYLMHTSIEDLRVIQSPLLVRDLRTVSTSLPGIYPERTRLRLRGMPVLSVDLIRKADSGEVVSADDYYLEEHSVLVFKYHVSEDILITYTFGSAPPAIGRMAARHLAAEFARLWGGLEEECGLPDRVTSVSRQGMTYTILDNQDFIQELRTGVYFVDLFLKTVNPAGARQRSRVFSPDVPRGKRHNAKALQLPVTTFDIAVSVSDPVSYSFLLSAAGATFLSSEPGWSLVFTARSYAGTRSVILPGPAGAVVAGSAIIGTIYYEDVVKTLGTVDPGTWDIYAERAGVVAYVATGNLRILLT